MWKNVLLLDSSYQPLRVIDGKKAIELLLSDKAEIVEAYENIPIRSAKLSLKLPSVLRLVKHFHRHRPRISCSKYNVFYRDNWTCQYCGERKKTAELSLDHVIPKSRRTYESRKSWENIVTACLKCNHKKANRTPEEAHMRLLKKPIKPNWTPLFTLRLKGTPPEAWEEYIRLLPMIPNYS